MARCEIIAGLTAGKVQIGLHRNVGNRRPIADRERVPLQMGFEDRQKIVQPLAQISQHVRIRRGREGTLETIGCHEAGELLIVPEQNSQRSNSNSSALVAAPKRPYCSASLSRIGAVWVSRSPSCSSTGISPISFTLFRHSGVRVTPPPQSVHTGSKFCPNSVSISASL